MCISIPLKVVNKNDSYVEVVQNKERMPIFVPTNFNDVQVGDWILAYGGVAIKIISEKEALESLDLISKLK